MDEINVLKGLFDKKILSILDILINDKSDEGLYLREIAKKSRVSAASTHRILNKLLDLEIINQTKIKQLKLYKANRTKQTKFLHNLLKKDIGFMKSSSCRFHPAPTAQNEPYLLLAPNRELPS